MNMPLPVTWTRIADVTLLDGSAMHIWEAHLDGVRLASLTQLHDKHGKPEDWFSGCRHRGVTFVGPRGKGAMPDDARDQVIRAYRAEVEKSMEKDRALYMALGGVTS